MAMGRGHHRPTNSTASGASAFSSTDFQYGAVGSQQWGDPPLNYYYDDNNNNNDSPPPQDCQKCDGCCACISRVCGGCCVFVPRGAGIWAVSSFVFWAVLWGFAASYPTEQQFVLNVGETWQVSTPPLWSRSTFEIYSYNPAMPMMATSTDGILAEPPEVGVEVYAFSPVMEGKNAKCPLPSPETAKKLHDTVTITLKGAAAAGGRGGDSGSESGRQYQYSYYHLNQGSKLSVDILQKKGSANIYLLQGYAALKSLEDDTSSASSSASFPPDFRRKSILKRYSGQGGETTFVYEAAVADFYILVYDNASTTTISSSSSSSSSGSSFSSKLIAQIDIDMAIHPLALQRRVCDAQQTSLQGGCLWKVSSYVDRRRVQASCIIVKAISTTSTSDDSSSGGGESGSGSGVIANANNISSNNNNNKDNDIDIDDSQVVGVRLQAKVGSVNLTLIASLPLLIGIFFLCREYGSDCIRRKKRRPSQGEDEVEEEPRLLWKKSSTSTKNNNRQHPRNTNYLSVLTNEDPEKLVASNTTNNSNYNNNNNNNNNMMMPTVAEKSASTTTSGSSYQKTIY